MKMFIHTLHMFLDIQELRSKSKKFSLNKTDHQVLSHIFFMSGWFTLWISILTFLFFLY